MQARRGRIASRILAGTALLFGLNGFAQEAPNEPPELSLDQAIQIAIANNRPLLAAKLNIAKSEWQVAETKTKRFPALSTELLATGDLTSPSFNFPKGIFGSFNNAPNPSGNVNIKLSSGITGYAIAKAAQPISQLYQIHLAVREQELSADLAGQSYKQNQQSVAASVKQAYYATLQTESALDAENALVKQYQETDRVALQYVSQESVLKSESLDVKAKLAQAEYQIVTLRDTLNIQKEQLNDLLGRDLDTPFRTQPISPVSLDEMDLKLARQTALQQRPEVKEAEINVSRAMYDRKFAKSQYIPGVGAEIRYFTPINTMILPQNILAAGVDMTWEPFDWGRRRDDVKQKDISLQQSQYQLAETRSQVLLDVDNTFRKLSESRALLAVAQAGRDAANERLREVNNQFKHSAVLLRDVLQQESAVANADQSYEDSLLSFWNAKAAFEKALGEE
jgi:outer membrane protein TolC